MSAYSFSSHGLAMRKVPQGVLDTVNQLLFDAGQVGGNLSFTDFSKIWQDSAGTTPYTAVEQYVGKIVDKSPNALVFTQATSAARPVVSARVNLFTESEFRHGVSDISVYGGAITATTLSGYLGGLSLQQNIVDGSYAYQPIYCPVGEYTYSVVLKMDDGLPPDPSVDFILVLFGGQYQVTIEDIGGGLYRAYSSMSGGQFNVYCGITKSPGSSARGFTVTALDIRPTSQSNLPYQRVNTPTDYDTAGFPNYAKFDGIDDNWVSASGGGGTAGIYYCGAIQFNKVGAVQTIFSDTGTNSGYKLQLTAANQLQISAGNGTAFTAINTTDVFALGDVSLCELWDDGTNLGVRLGEGTPVTVARPVVTAGTAQITLGKDNNAASNYAGIGMFEPVWRYGAMPNTTQREAIRAICRSKAGIV